MTTLKEIDPKVVKWFGNTIATRKKFYEVLCDICSSNLRGRYHYQLFNGYSTCECLCDPCRTKAENFERALSLLSRSPVETN